MVKKQDPKKINKFIEKFGGGADLRDDASISQEFTNFFSARENKTKSGQLSSSRPKTSDRNVITAKSFDTLSPKTASIKFSAGPVE